MKNIENWKIYYIYKMIKFKLCSLHVGNNVNILLSIDLTRALIVKVKENVT